MSGRTRRPGSNQQDRRKRSTRTSWWSQLREAALKAQLRGHRQWQLLSYLEKLGCGKYPNRGIFITRRELARLLELTGDLRWHGRNTGRREQRFQVLGLITIVIGGGRLKGCGKAQWRGRANRIYPGPKVAPKDLVRKRIEQDDQREAGQEQLDGPPATPGQVLAQYYLDRGPVASRGP